MSGGMPMPPGSEDKLSKYWPEEDETSYTRHAADQMTLARQVEEHRGTTQQKQNYAASDMKGLAAETLARELGIKVSELNAAVATHEMTAGWLTQGHADIMAYKNALTGAYGTYKSQMSAALTQGSIAGVIKVNDQIESQFRQTCDSAKSGYDKSRDAIADGVKLGTKPPMKGPAPAAGKPSLNAGDNSLEATGQRAPDAVNPSLYDPSTGGYSSPAQGAGANTPGGSGPAAGGGPTAGGPVAGGGGPAAGGPAADLGGGSAGAGVGSGSGAGGPSAGGGNPMGGGMPIGGMPQMQPPQMPQMPGGGQTPGSDLAKTGADMVTKLAGADKGAGAGGVPVTPDQLEKLLSKQGDGGGGLGGEKGEGPTGEGPNGKGDKKLNGGGTTVNGPGGGGNNAAGGPGAHPAAPAGPPSPAAPVTTHAPAAPSAAPMTELSADETPAGQQPPRAQDQQHHNAPAGNAQSTAASMSPFPGPPPAAVGQTSSAAPGPMMMGPMAPPPASLGTYSPGALGAGPAPTATPPPQAIPASAVAAGAATAAPFVLPTRVGDGSSRGEHVTNYAVTAADPEFVARIEALNPDHALVHLYLAQLMASVSATGWLTTAAIAVLAHADPTAAPLYVLATADGLSVVPAGTDIPGRLRLLTEFKLDDTFVSRWAGYEHPGAILAAFAAHPASPAGYKLVYLLSSDTAESKAGRYHTGGVTEIVQLPAERAWLHSQHREPARPRAACGATIAAHKAADALAAFGRVWKVDDATDVKHAMADLWADRWESADHGGSHYTRTLARYWHAEAHTLIAAGNLPEAAYAISELARLEP